MEPFRYVADIIEFFIEVFTWLIPLIFLIVAVVLFTLGIHLNKKKKGKFNIVILTFAILLFFISMYLFLNISVSKHLIYGMFDSLLNFLFYT